MSNCSHIAPKLLLIQLANLDGIVLDPSFGLDSQTALKLL